MDQYKSSTNVCYGRSGRTELIELLISHLQSVYGVSERCNRDELFEAAAASAASHWIFNIAGGCIAPWQASNIYYGQL